MKQMNWRVGEPVEANSLTKEDAANKLKQLMATNFIFQNNKPLVEEIQKRLKAWS